MEYRDNMMKGGVVLGSKTDKGIKRVFSGNGSSSYTDSGRYRKRTESEEKRQESDIGAFGERAGRISQKERSAAIAAVSMQDGQKISEVKENGKTLSYTRTKAEKITPKAQKIKAWFIKKGIPAVVIDGGYSSLDKNGVLYSSDSEIYGASFHGDRILINNNSDLSEKNIEYHEMIHAYKKIAPKIYNQFFAEVNAIGINCDSKLLGDIDGVYSYAENSLGIDLLLEETAAQISGYHYDNPRFAREKFGDVFWDYDALIVAIEKAHNDYDAQYFTEAAADDVAANFMPENNSVFSEPNLQEGADTEDWIKKFLRESSGIAPPLTDGQKYVKSICDKLGIKVSFNYDGVGDGYYTNGTIYLKPNTSRPLLFVFKHELTHYLENSENYAEFKDYLFKSDAFQKWLTDNGFSHRGTMRQDIINRYAKNGVKLNYAEADKEMVADFVGEQLFSSKGEETGFLDCLAKENRNLLKRIFDWISDMINRFKGTSIENDLRTLERKFIRLKETKSNKKSATNSDG
ncbi:MAG: hypothetical protein RR177_06975, partial [Oscillospiraceae bacterium]